MVSVMALLYEDETYQILGACFAVYKEMGCGFLEAVYHECLIIEFRQRGIPFESKKRLQLRFRNQILETYYEADFICFDKIILEIKAVSALNDAFRAVVHNYLRATGYRLGMLANFGSHPKLEHERIIRQAFSVLSVSSVV